MKLEWRVGITVIISCLLALIVGVCEETYAHIFSSYFSDEMVESYGYLYYYQFNLIHFFLKDLLFFLSEKLNWYNIIISLICLASIYAILIQFAKYRPNTFTWITVAVAAVVFSVDIFNIHFTRASGLSAVVCVTTILVGYRSSIFIPFFIIGLLTRNETFWLACIAVCPFLLLAEKPFNKSQKIALISLLVIPVVMFALVNITRYSYFKTQYTYEKNLDTGGFFFAWKSIDDIQDSTQYIKYKIFDNDIFADTVNVPQEYLIANFRQPDRANMLNKQIEKLTYSLEHFIDYYNYPILSLYLLSFLLIFPLYLWRDKGKNSVLKKLIIANITSFLLLCGITCLFKFEPACQETILSFLIFINYFYLVSPEKKMGKLMIGGLLLLVMATFYLIYSKQKDERDNTQNIIRAQNAIAEKCKGKLVIPVGRLFNVFMKHPNPFLLNDNAMYKDILLVHSYGGPLGYMGSEEKMNKYFSANTLYNYDLIKQVSQCKTCNSVFVATVEDIDLYKTYYRLIYKCDIEFTKTDEVGSGLPFFEGQIYLFDPPVLKCLSDTLR